MHVCKRKSMLYVDCENNNAKGLRRLLKAKYNVFSASNIFDGYGLLEAGKPLIHMVIVEYKLPGQKGLDFLARVKKEYPHIVRVLTSTLDAPDIKKALESGAIHSHLQKPWDMEKLELMLPMKE